MKLLNALLQRLRHIREKISYGKLQAYEKFQPKKILKKRAKLTMVVDRPATCVFFVEFPESWQSFESIYVAMKDDPRFVPTVIAMVNSPYLKTVSTTNVQVLSSRSIPFRTSDFYDPAMDLPDVVFCHNPYDIEKGYRFKFFNLFQSIPRIVYISYGFEIAGGRNSSQFNMAVQKWCWKIFVHSESAKHQYGLYCESGNAHVEPIGHPMLDTVKNYNIDEYRGQRPEVDLVNEKTFLWCPHHSETRNESDLSTFLRWKDLLFEHFSENPDIHLLLRPHPLLFTVLVREKLMTEGEVEALKLSIENSPNIHLDTSSDYLYAFAVSDCLLTDASSFLILYPATEKPIIYLNNPTGKGLGYDGAVVDYYHTAEKWEEIEVFIKMVQEGRDDQKEYRLENYKNYIHQPKTGAGNSIAEYIFQSLKQGI